MASDDNNSEGNGWPWANVPLPSSLRRSGLTFDDLLQPLGYSGMPALGYANAGSSGSARYWADTTGAYNNAQAPEWSSPQASPPAPFSLASAVAALPAPAAPTGYRFGWDGPINPGPATAPLSAPYVPASASAFASHDLSGMPLLPGSRPLWLSFDQMPLPQTAPFSFGAGPFTQQTQAPNMRLNWDGPAIHFDPYPPVTQPAEPSPYADSENMFTPYGDFPQLTPEQSKDILKSAGIGLANGTIDVAGLLGDALTGFGHLPKNALMNSYLAGQGLDQLPPDIPDVLDAIRSDNIKNSVESHTGKFYEPQTPGGRFAEQITRLVPGIAGGEGIAAVKGLRNLTVLSDSELARAAWTKAKEMVGQIPREAIIPGAIIQGVGEAKGEPAKKNLQDLDGAYGLLHDYAYPAYRFLRHAGS